MPPKAIPVNAPAMTHDDLVRDFLKLQVEFKRLQKLVKKMNKSETVDDDAPKKLSGFAKPMPMSPALCEFLGVEKDAKMSRTDVTKELNAYIKKEQLQNSENKREISLDNKLKTILDVPTDVTLTFFNLQKYMSPHFMKEAPVSEQPSEVEPPSEEETPPTPKKIVKKVVKKVVNPSQ